MPYYGSKVLGSGDILTSVAGAEILTEGSVRGFELVNDQPCTISINGGDPIHFRALQGVALELAHSVKIQENGITFNWIGTLQ